jgi:1,4-alpha-glucan branching enzyme
MDFRYAACLVLEAHVPYVKEYSGENDLSQSGEEGWFFEAVSRTYLPLLEVMDRLESDHIPFKFGLSISPLLCQMLCDEHLIKKYLFYADKQIEFGRQELEHTKGQLHDLIQYQYDKIADRRASFTERYGENLLRAFDSYKRRGKIEILAGSATHAFLPIISRSSESMQAQFEAPMTIFRRYFGGTPQGFWLPELGWTSAIEQYLKAYNYSYTIIDTHGLLFANPFPQKGIFYPVKTPGGIIAMARDFYAAEEIAKMPGGPCFLDYSRDAGYEYPSERVNMFLSADGQRHKTGYQYWPISGDIYNQQAAFEKAEQYARSFLETTTSRLEEAAKYMQQQPVSLLAYNADQFGRFWHEGPQFIESLFRMAGDYHDFQFVTPSEYIYKQNFSDLQVVTPEFSSWGINGYAETWLSASNDWIYRHLIRSMERMNELAERFPDDSGLKERALNQAAREILLAQSSDWSSLLYKQDSTEYARNQAENALRNFTTIYEALGSSYISTEWLTKLEHRHNFFPSINYRVFRRKK